MRSFSDAVVVQVLNPKVASFFLAFLPQFLDPARGSAALQVVALGVAFTVPALVSDGMYVLAVGTMASWFGARTSRRQWLPKVGGGVYICLGVVAAFAETRLVGSRTEPA